MDTKLINNEEIEFVEKKKAKHNLWGYLIMLLVIAGATVAVMQFYGFFEEQIFRNALTVVRFPESYSEGYYAEIGDKIYLFQNHWSVMEGIAYMALGFFLLTALAAFVTALIKPLGMTNKKIFRTPFELVILLGGFFIALSIGDGPFGFVTQLAWQSLTGELAYALSQEFYMNPYQARELILALNAVYWVIFFTVTYWACTCLAAVFTLGPVRYFKERTITGLFLRWCKKLFKETYSLVDSVDFKDPSTKPILKVVALNFILLTVISCFWFYGIFGLLIYSIGLFFVLRKNYFKMQEKYKLLLNATNELAEGNLDVEIAENLGVFEPFRGEIGKIQSGFKKAVEEEVKSQSMKTELITNVSHDLKTPLTAIITYVDLLKKEDITPEERSSYIQVLEQKSMRLKRLIEDLFEVSKANSQNVTLNLVEVDVVNLMKQVRLELEDSIEESRIDFKWRLPESRITLGLDSEKTYRVFENLLVNIIKYAMPGTRAYVDMEETNEEVCISMKNISAAEISLNGSEISERFVRGDASRNTEGSGLGLAIVKSFVELQKGRFEVVIEADLFKVMIIWKKES